MAMKRLLRNLLTDVRGATAIEYGLILALVVLGLMAALIALANSSTSLWTDVSTQVRDAH
jgi:pilus assembly protein Flp/PilA